MNNYCLIGFNIVTQSETYPFEFLVVQGYFRTLFTRLLLHLLEYIDLYLCLARNKLANLKRLLLVDVGTRTRQILPLVLEELLSIHCYGESVTRGFPGSG